MTDQDPRTVDLEVTVPGTPEQVWDAIATGPGISSWLHPTRVDEHVGGAFSFDMGGSAEAPTGAAGHRHRLHAPHRFATEAPWSTGGQSTTLATEWLVAARDEGTCVVRIVMSGFGPGDDWDDEIDALREGMGVALETLRLYLAHFPGGGRPSSRPGRRSPVPRAPRSTPCSGPSPGRGEVGDRVVLAGTPSLAGTVEVLSPGEHRCDVVLLVDTPGPGVADLATYGADAGVGVHLTVFDAPDTDAARVAERERPRWTAWTRRSDDHHTRPRAARARGPHPARPARRARPLGPARRPPPALRAARCGRRPAAVDHRRLRVPRRRLPRDDGDARRPHRRRRLLLVGAAAFGVASLAAAFAPTPELLIAARAALGIAGATLMPSALALVTELFPDPRPRAPPWPSCSPRSWPAARSGPPSAGCCSPTSGGARCSCPASR